MLNTDRDTDRGEVVGFEELPTGDSLVFKSLLEVILEGSKLRSN